MNRMITPGEAGASKVKQVDDTQQEAAVNGE